MLFIKDFELGSKVSSACVDFEKNVEFCQSLGCYDEVITYDQGRTLDNNESIMIVDMAGNFSAMQDLHEHFADNVKYSCSVGATHQANQKDFNVGDMNSFPGATPTFFFAPTQAQKRTILRTFYPENLLHL